RAMAGCGGVLCQLEAEGRFRDEALRWLPGFADFDPLGAGAEDGTGDGAADGAPEAEAAS
ncbi:hypothetical protein AB0J52_40295, partial [Spirillospora sp. NPDC049652]